MFEGEHFEHNKYQEKHHPRRKKFINRNRRIVDLVDRHANGLSTLNDYFLKIGKTIGKKLSVDFNVSNSEISS